MMYTPQWLSWMAHEEVVYITSQLNPKYVSYQYVGEDRFIYLKTVYCRFTSHTEY